MIVRDEYGIIVQHNLDYLNQADGGDSASRTGIMALCGSEQDKSLLVVFLGVMGPGIVRHPHQEQWNDVKKTSRDLVVCWAAGSDGSDPEINRTIYDMSLKYFINKDFLTPNVRLFLRLKSGVKPSFVLKFFGDIFLDAQIYLNTKITPDIEQNQLLSMLLALAKIDDIYKQKLINYVKAHPGLLENLQKYWSGKPWRDQYEIYQALVGALAKRLQL